MRLYTRYRLILVFILMAHAYTASRWDFILFLSGLLLAESDQIQGNPPPRTSAIDELPEPKRKTQLTALWVWINLLGLWFLSQPDGYCEATPGWKTLCSMIPAWWEKNYEEKRRRYYQTLGEILFTASISHLSLYRRIFESGVVQYLGKISYALYLVHGMCIRTVGYTIAEFMWTHMPGAQDSMFQVAFVISGCLTFIFTLWIADMFWRGIDMPSVKFARKVEGWVSRD